MMTTSEASFDRGDLWEIGSIHLDASGFLRPLSTGVPALDCALHGGYRVNRMVALLGPSELTTAIALQAIAPAQKCGGGASLLTFDRVTSSTAAARHGVDLDAVEVREMNRDESMLSALVQHVGQSDARLHVVELDPELSPSRASVQRALTCLRRDAARGAGTVIVTCPRTLGLSPHWGSAALSERFLRFLAAQTIFLQSRGGDHAGTTVSARVGKNQRLRNFFARRATLSIGERAIDGRYLGPLGTVEEIRLHPMLGVSTGWTRGRLIEVTEAPGLEAFCELTPISNAEVVEMAEVLRSGSANGHLGLHAPPTLLELPELERVELLRRLPHSVTAIVVDSDTIADASLYRSLGARLVIENADRRQSRGRTATELRDLLAQLPAAGLCLDLARAWSVDPSMKVGREILDEFGDRLRQVHLSSMDEGCRHVPLSRAHGELFLPLLARCVHVPWILEEALGSEIWPRSRNQILTASLKALLGDHMGIRTAHELLLGVDPLWGDHHAAMRLSHDLHDYVQACLSPGDGGARFRNARDRAEAVYETCRV